MGSKPPVSCVKVLCLTNQSMHNRPKPTYILSEPVIITQSFCLPQVIHRTEW